VSDVAIEITMPPDLWMQVAGVYVHITPVNDPLLRAHLHRVVVHRDDRSGHLWVQVDGNNAGVCCQTLPPETHDFMNTDGEPL
jgi:hypothetical protein